MSKKPGARRLTAKRRAALEVAATKKSFTRRYGFTPRIKQGDIVLTAGQQRTIHSVHRAQRREWEQRRNAIEAREHYRIRKKDLGRVVMIGRHGQSDPQKKGKKGYAAYVSTTGKIRLLKSGYKEQPYKARRLREIELPLQRNLHKRIAAFKLATVGAGRIRRERSGAAVAEVNRRVKRFKLTGSSAGEYGDFRLSGRGKGRVEVKLGGAHDFNHKAVKKIAAHLRTVIRSQRGQRTFNIKVIGLIELPDKSREVVTFDIGIARNDSDAIRLAGVENFVRQKFYAFMARELAFRGLVTRGSANHIRRLAANEGQDRSEWVDRRGQLWAGRDLEVINLVQLEWKIEQAK